MTGVMAHQVSEQAQIGGAQLDVFRIAAPKVASFKCPSDKAQAFLWDATVAGLGLRATPAGKPSYIFQAEFQGRSLRVTIGSPDAWSIPQAQEKAHAGEQDRRTPANWAMCFPV